jgi:hypothetical protein
MDMINHSFKVAHVTLVPNARGNPQCIITFRVNRALLGINRTPTTLSLYATMSHIHARGIGACTITVGYLIKSVSDSFGTYLNWSK